jgi:hypothetical protein
MKSEAKTKTESNDNDSLLTEAMRLLDEAEQIITVAHGRVKQSNSAGRSLWAARGCLMAARVLLEDSRRLSS